MSKQIGATRSRGRPRIGSTRVLRITLPDALWDKLDVFSLSEGVDSGDKMGEKVRCIIDDFFASGGPERSVGVGGSIPTLKPDPADQILVGDLDPQLLAAALEFKRRIQSP